MSFLVSCFLFFSCILLSPSILLWYAGGCDWKEHGGGAPRYTLLGARKMGLLEMDIKVDC